MNIILFALIAVIILVLSLWIIRSFSSKKTSEEKLIEKLHANFEQNGSREEKIRAAAEISDVAYSLHLEKKRWGLHKAFDVLLCRLHFEKSEYGSELHKRYWELGSNIAKTIRKLNNGVGPNVPALWYAENYEEAMSGKSTASRYDQS